MDLHQPTSHIYGATGGSAGETRATGVRRLHLVGGRKANRPVGGLYESQRRLGFGNSRMTYRTSAYIHKQALPT